MKYIALVMTFFLAVFMLKGIVTPFDQEAGSIDNILHDRTRTQRHVDVEVEDLSDDWDSSALESYITKYMDAHNICGLSAAIVKNGQNIWTGSFGNAQVDPDKPVIDDSLFMLASVTKTITGVALMQLYEAGKFDLDDPINDYLPFPVIHPAHPRTDISFRMLLSHTSGIEDNWSVMPYYQGDSPIRLGVYLHEYLTPGGVYYHPVKNFYPWKPGTNYEYCNNGLALAGYLVEILSGIPLEAYCQQHLFTPLEMKETSYFLAYLNPRHIAMPYGWNGNKHFPYGHQGYSDWPSGTLRTSAPQLVRFLSTFWKNKHPVEPPGALRILQSDTVNLMLTPQYPHIEPTQGLVWYSWKLGNRNLVGHDGSDPGITTEMWYSPEENTGVVALTNSESLFPGILNALFHYASLQ